MRNRKPECKWEAANTTTLLGGMLAYLVFSVKNNTKITRFFNPMSTET
jgi:hypothetical protein